MQNVAHLFNSSEEYAMNVVEFPEVETAYDKVGVYDQDAVNGFSEQMLTTTHLPPSTFPIRFYVSIC